MIRKFTFVVAPGVPLEETRALEAHIHEALADPDYTVITNYEAKVADLGPEEFLLLCADSVPCSEVMALRERIDKVKTGEAPAVIVVNYDLDVTAVKRTQPDVVFATGPWD
jgi:hypothetical protein